MNRNEIQKRAKELENQDKRSGDYFVNVMAWLGYLGLLRNNYVKPKRVSVTLKDVIKAAEIEPRIYELLPAMLIYMPRAFEFQKSEIPKDLDDTVRAIKKKNTIKKTYKGIPAEKYMRWIKSDVLKVAKRRLSFRTAPRKRENQTTEIGHFVRDRRIRLALTQEALAKRCGVSVRVIRDLEQGRMSASLVNVSKILEVFSAKLKISF